MAACIDVQVIVVPILCGLSGRGVKPATWLSALVAFGGMGLLEHGGAPAGVGDLLSLLSALFFGIQVWLLLLPEHLLCSGYAPSH